MYELEALWVVRFEDVGGTFHNGGVVVLETNRVFGGDASYFYVGDYSAKDGTLSGSLRVAVHNPPAESAWGDYLEDFKIAFELKRDSEVMRGSMWRTEPANSMKLKLDMRRVADLPG